MRGWLHGTRKSPSLGSKRLITWDEEVSQLGEQEADDGEGSVWRGGRPRVTERPGGAAAEGRGQGDAVTVLESHQGQGDSHQLQDEQDEVGRRPARGIPS